jgi:glucosamine--fructose-6-phosphate aminotransferase (isomerizing)
MGAATTSEMEQAIRRQPAELRRLLDDIGPVERVAEQLRGRSVCLIGTGTSWHAANHAAWLLRDAHTSAVPVQAIDAATYDLWREFDAVLVFSHTNSTRFANEVAAKAKAAGVPVHVIGARGAGADIETVDPERSSAYTVSHLGALARVAQLATLLGADLGDLSAVPDAVERVVERDDGFEAPERLVEFTGVGSNQWTAAEGALKARETSYVATEGLSVEQMLHGPAIALDERDALVVLDGGGPGSDRVQAAARAAAAAGVRVTTLEERDLGEALSIFPLTVGVQLIALRLALQLGVDPDCFRRPAKPSWDEVGF